MKETSRSRSDIEAVCLLAIDPSRVYTRSARSNHTAHETVRPMTRTAVVVAAVTEKFD